MQSAPHLLYVAVQSTTSCLTALAIQLRAQQTRALTLTTKQADQQKCLYGLEALRRNAKRTHELLPFLETTKNLLQATIPEGPEMSGPSFSEYQALRGLG